MGYRFHKTGAEPFYIRLSDAGTVRSAARTEGLVHLMPDTETSGGKIPVAARAVLAKAFREQAAVLSELANYFDDADNLRWGH